MFTRTRITSGLAALAFVGGSMFAFASTANAEVTFPADSEDACVAAGGTFAQDTTANYCTVKSETERTVSASHKQQAWTATLTDTVTTLYGKQTTTESVQTGCKNHNGNSIDDWQTNPNCKPSAN